MHLVAIDLGTQVVKILDQVAGGSQLLGPAHDI
jgi:hypothetical protein